MNRLTVLLVALCLFLMITLCGCQKQETPEERLKHSMEQVQMGIKQTQQDSQKLQKDMQDLSTILNKGK